MSTEELINTNIYFCRVSSYQELFFHCLHAMLSSTHHIDIQYRQHVFLQPVFFLHLWPMEGMAPDPCHFSEVPKTCEQPHALVINVPERSTYCLSLVTSILRWLKQKDTQKFERNQKHVTLQPTMSSRDWSENGCSNTPEINLTLRIRSTASSIRDIGISPVSTKNTISSKNFSNL